MQTVEVEDGGVQGGQRGGGEACELAQRLLEGGHDRADVGLALLVRHDGGVVRVEHRPLNGSERGTGKMSAKMRASDRAAAGFQCTASTSYQQLQGLVQAGRNQDRASQGGLVHATHAMPCSRARSVASPGQCAKRCGAYRSRLEGACHQGADGVVKHLLRRCAEPVNHRRASQRSPHVRSRASSSTTHTRAHSKRPKTPRPCRFRFDPPNPRAPTPAESYSATVMTRRFSAPRRRARVRL